MKKYIVLFCLVVCYIVVFAVGAYAVQGKWFNPKYLKTYIQPNHRNTVMMKHAFAEWSRLTKNKIVFHYVTSPNVAQIEVSFVKKIDTQNNKNLDRAIGLTNSIFTKTKITHAKIYIADLTQDDRTLNKDEIYTVMLHEIGHAVGLNHSSNPESVMYSGANVIQEITNADLKILADLYGWQ